MFGAGILVAVQHIDWTALESLRHVCFKLATSRPISPSVGCAWPVSTYALFCNASPFHSARKKTGRIFVFGFFADYLGWSYTA